MKEEETSLEDEINKQNQNMKHVGVQRTTYQLEKKNKAQCESSELSFIWGKMRNIAWETATQRALRNCSKELWGRSVYI